MDVQAFEFGEWSERARDPEELRILAEHGIQVVHQNGKMIGIINHDVMLQRVLGAPSGQSTANPADSTTHVPGVTTVNNNSATAERARWGSRKARLRENYP